MFSSCGSEVFPQETSEFSSMEVYSLEARIPSEEASEVSIASEAVSTVSLESSQEPSQENMTVSVAEVPKAHSKAPVEQGSKAPEVAASKAPDTAKQNTQTNNNFNKYNIPEQQNTTEYVLNTSTKKYHLPSCNYVKKISPKNYSTCGDLDEIKSMGYVACKKCLG